MEKLTKGEVIELLDKGHVLKQVLMPDLGTSSVIKPIKLTGRHTSKFSIAEHQVHHATGFALIKTLKKVSHEFKGLGIVKYYKKREEKKEEPYCTQCGSKEFSYVEQYANGECWKCKDCGQETMREPKDFE